MASEKPTEPQGDWKIIAIKWASDIVQHIEEVTLHIQQEASPETPLGDKILIVDDEEYLANLLGETIEHDRKGCTLVAYDIEGAFRVFLANKDRIGLLVTDLTFGGKPEGWNLIRRIRSVNPSLPCILLSWDKKAVREAIIWVENIKIAEKPILGKPLRALVDQLLPK